MEGVGYIHEVWKFKISLNISSFTEYDKCREFLLQQWNFIIFPT